MGEAPTPEWMNQAAGQMPLVKALLKFADSGRESWHMPGHRGGQDLPKWLKKNLAFFDVTELPQTDDINHAAGPAREAMILAASAFNAGLTRFITSGSTAALQILLALCLGRGGRLLIPRFVHQSIIHAAAILDLELCWIDSQASCNVHEDLSLLPHITAQEVEIALDRHRDCQAVLITSPDYYGSCADLTAIAAAVHRRGKLLLVDEAHGAHLNFGPDDWPASAMQAGADACVQSGHKTLPVLTPGAYLHIGRMALSEGKIDANQLDRLLPVFQTSSPSFPIAASLDYARAFMEADGRKWISMQLKQLGQFFGKLPPGFTCSPAVPKPDTSSGFLRDPLRLILTGPAESGSAFPAQMAARHLSQAGIDIEFADLTRLVLIPSLQQPQAFWRRLCSALRQIELTFESGGLLEMEKEWRHYLMTPGEQILLPGEALFKNHNLRKMPLKESVGQISAQSILPYPPGIPLIIPGERIERNRVDFLQRLLDNKISISGIDQDRLLVLS